MATEAPPLTIDEPGFVSEFDRIFGDDLTPEAERDLEELLAQQAADEAEREASDLAAAAKALDKPDRRRFVNVGNGLYLPVRQRIVWMRGEPEPHPDWLIQTEIVRFEEGQVVPGSTVVFLNGRNQTFPKVERGFAVVQARVLVRNPDGSEGPIIGEGSAMERSEGFPDFLEKAETAAIGRALAVAGYGTEAAIDLDEGVEQGNVVDAPAQITITPSAVPGVRQGGRQTKITQAQIDNIRAAARDKMLAPSRLQQVIREAVPPPPNVDDENLSSFYIDDVEDDPNGANDVLGFLSGLTFEEAGQVVQALEKES